MMGTQNGAGKIEVRRFNGGLGRRKQIKLSALNRASGHLHSEPSQGTILLRVILIIEDKIGNQSHSS